jgi:hypothetical protein
MLAARGIRSASDPGRFPCPARVAASPSVADIDAVSDPLPAIVAIMLEVMDIAADTEAVPERFAVIVFPIEKLAVTSANPFTYVVEDTNAPFGPRTYEYGGCVPVGNESRLFKNAFVSSLKKNRLYITSGRNCAR